MNVIYEPQLDFSDVLLKPKRSTLASRKEVILDRVFRGYHNKDLSFNVIPIAVANMSAVTTWKMAKAIAENNMIIAMDKFKTVDDWIENKNLVSKYHNNIWYTFGIRDGEYEQFMEIIEVIEDISHVVIDVPNGYIEKFPEFIRKVRTENPKLYITAGNVVSGEMTQELLLAGADCVKIGIGSGAACSTRLKSGVGRPQLSSIIECADAAHGLGGNIMSDGGIRTSGDFSKAFCAGADFTMAGSYFAGVDETDGEIIDEKNKKYKINYGMSSSHAMEKHYGGQEQHRASEGLVIKIPYNGSINNVVSDLFGGMRSTGTYIGAKTIKDFPKCTTFYTVNRQTEHTFEKIGE